MRRSRSLILVGLLALALAERRRPRRRNHPRRIRRRGRTDLQTEHQGQRKDPQGGQGRGQRGQAEAGSRATREGLLGPEEDPGGAAGDTEARRRSGDAGQVAGLREDRGRPLRLDREEAEGRREGRLPRRWRSSSPATQTAPTILSLTSNSITAALSPPGSPEPEGGAPSARTRLAADEKMESGREEADVAAPHGQIDVV